MINGWTIDTIGSNLTSRLTLLGVDSCGTLLWRKSFTDINCPYSEPGNSTASSTKIGNHVYYSIARQGQACFPLRGTLFKLKLNGDSVWTKSFGAGDSSDLITYSVKPSADGKLLVLNTVKTYSPSFNGHYITSINIRKIDTNGVQLWSKSMFPANLDWITQGIDIVQDQANGNIFVVGKVYIGNIISSAVYRFDSAGNYIDNIAQGRPEFGTSLLSIIQCEDGNFIAGGKQYVGENPKWNLEASLAHLVKFDKNGNVLFYHSYENESPVNEILRVLQLPDKTIISLAVVDTGIFVNYTASSIIRLMRISNNGDLVWAKYFDNTGLNVSDVPSGLCITQSGKIAFTNTAYENQSTPHPYTLFLTDTSACDLISFRCLNPTGIEEKEISHMKIFPNPADEMFMVESGNLSDEINFSVYDLSGCLLYKSESMSGKPVLVQTSDFKAGVYIYKVKVNDSAEQNGKISVMH